MKIEHGKFYIKRGGDTVGPAYRHEGRISEETWQIGDQWYDDQGVCSTGTPFVNDVVAFYQEPNGPAGVKSRWDEPGGKRKTPVSKAKVKSAKRFVVLRREQAANLMEDVLVTLSTGLRDSHGKVVFIHISAIDPAHLQTELLKFLNSVCPYPEIAGINDEIPGYDLKAEYVMPGQH